jgi:hypothetical protein
MRLRGISKNSFHFLGIFNTLKCKGQYTRIIFTLRVIGKVILRIFGCTFDRETDTTQLSYVTFKDSQGADTAVLLSVCSSRMMAVELLILELHRNFHRAEILYI